MDNLSLNYTGIGSVPFRGEHAIKDSLDFIFKKFQPIPYVPELINYSKLEGMVLRFSENMAGFLEVPNGYKIEKNHLFFRKQRFINKNYRPLLKF